MVVKSTQSVMEGPWLNEHYDKDKCIIERTKKGQY